MPSYIYVSLGDRYGEVFVAYLVGTTFGEEVLA